jgi:guanylate kinase
MVVHILHNGSRQRHWTGAVRSVSHDIDLGRTFDEEGGDAVIAALRARREPRMFVISGPSGVGKDAIIKILRELLPDIHVAVTATTRERRPGEADGVDYFFYAPEYFQQQREAGEFLEFANVYGNWYGVPKHSVRHALERGQDVIVKVDVQGAATIRNLAPDATFIFVCPGTSEELLQRLRARKMDDPDALMRRFREAEAELRRASEFDYVVFNANSESRLPDQAVHHIHSIIMAERLRYRQVPAEI